MLAKRLEPIVAWGNSHRQKTFQHLTVGYLSMKPLRSTVSTHATVLVPSQDQ
jgi:hypothetical protein